MTLKQKLRLYPEYWERDRFAQSDETIGGADLLEVQTSRGRVQGILLSPNHRAGELHPAVLMLHGFPGVASNHELGQALRRIGFTVAMPCAPGAWGSDGAYSLDGNVDAACEVAEYLRSPEVAAQYHIDPDRMFLLGHSMGGFAALNAAPRLPWMRATVLIAPCDIDWFFRVGKLDYVYNLPRRAERVLHTDENLTETAFRIHEEYSFERAPERMRERNILLVECLRDQAIPTEMLRPLRERLEGGAFDGGVQRYVALDTDHAFNDSKNLMAKTVADFLVPLAE